MKNSLLYFDACVLRRMKPRWCTMRNVITCFAVQIVIMLSRGFIVSFGAVYSALLETFKDSHGLTSSVQTTAAGVMALTAVLSGMLCQRFGPVISTLLGGTLLSIGLIVSFFVNGVVHLIFSIGIIGGLGCSLLIIGGFTAAVEVVVGPKYIILGIMSSATSYGAVLLQQLEYLFVSRYGIRGCFLILAGLTLNTIPAGMVFRRRSKKQDPEQQKSDKESKYWNYNLLKKPLFVCYLVVLFLNGISVFYLSLTIAEYCIEIGYQPSFAVLLLSIVTLLGIPGKFSDGAVAQYNSKYAIPFISGNYIVVGTCGILLPFAVRSESLMVLLGLFGISFGGALAFREIGPSVILAPEQYTMGLCMGNTVLGVGNLVSGPMLGTLRDITGSYLVPFTMMGAIACAAGVILLTVNTVVARKTNRSIRVT